MRLGALLLLTAISAHAQDPDSFSVKGVPMGAREADVRKAHPKARCDTGGNQSYWDRQCFVFDNSYAGLPATLGYFFIDDRMGYVLVTIKSSDFDEIVKTMTDTYGKPTSVIDSEISTRMGVKYTNRKAQWTSLPHVTIEAERYGSSIDKGAVRFNTPEYLRDAATRKKALDDQRKKDL